MEPDGAVLDELVRTRDQARKNQSYRVCKLRTLAQELMAKHPKANVLLIVQSAYSYELVAAVGGGPDFGDPMALEDVMTRAGAVLAVRQHCSKDSQVARLAACTTPEQNICLNFIRQMLLEKIVGEATADNMKRHLLGRDEKGNVIKGKKPWISDVIAAASDKKEEQGGELGDEEELLEELLPPLTHSRLESRDPLAARLPEEPTAAPAAAVEHSPSQPKPAKRQRQSGQGQPRAVTARPGARGRGRGAAAAGRTAAAAARELQLPAAAALGAAAAAEQEGGEHSAAAAGGVADAAAATEPRLPAAALPDAAAAAEREGGGEREAPGPGGATAAAAAAVLQLPASVPPDAAAVAAQAGGSKRRTRQPKPNGWFSSSEYQLDPASMPPASEDVSGEHGAASHAAVAAAFWERERRMRMCLPSGATT